MRRFALSSVFFLLFCAPSAAQAVTSGRSVPSSFGGNGQNASFDGRLFITRDSVGWRARILRPEALTLLPDGLPDANGPMWTAPTSLLEGGAEIHENALAICEPDPAKAPFACDDAGNANAAGPYACYDVVLIDSDAVVAEKDGGFVMRRRTLKLWVSSPGAGNAAIHKFTMGTTLEKLTPALKGIEPTVTRDGKLLVWQGHPANDGEIDTLVYSYNATPCAASGWTAPKSITAMHIDPLVAKYPLSERPLRSTDGSLFGPSEVLRGAYPWLMPEGDAIVFTAANMPCRSDNDPGGCGPRRNAWSVLGYPTNWAVAHVDGGVNPSTADAVRLFFSSPGATTFTQLPVTKGFDVWPFFGTNTSNYVELTFDDGLDGQYAGMWHMNESIGKNGDFETAPAKTPDVSGYFNTGVLRGGLSFAQANDGFLGKSLVFDGVDDRVEIPDSPSLSPVNGITIDFMIRPLASPDCDGNNNYRYLIGKGSIADGAFSIMLEESLGLFARVNVAGQMKLLAAPAVALGAWTHVTFEYDGATGRAAFWYDGNEVATGDFGKGTIQKSTQPLLLGGPGARAACPNGDGAFRGQLDEVSVSRIARHTWKPELGNGAPVPPVPSTAPKGKPPTPGVGGTIDGDELEGNGVSDGGCAQAPERARASWAVTFLALGFAALRLARRRSQTRALRRATTGRSRWSSS